MFVLCCIWFIVAFLWITITSALDKEWMIDGRGINNVCDVLMYLEEDDTRDVGVIMTLPLFFPFLWFALWRKKRGWFMYATALAIFGYWLWQFFLRYQFCLGAGLVHPAHKLTNFPPDDLCPQTSAFSPFVYR